MSKRLIFFLIVGAPPSILSGQKMNPDWILETSHAVWDPRGSQSEFVFGNKMWIMGSWFNSYEAPPNDVWNSKDGKDWILIEKAAPWTHSDLAMSVVFKNRMWIMGGWYNGRLPDHSATNSVWSSKDGDHWVLVTEHAGWSPRLGSTVVKFKGKLWLLGGTESYYLGDGNSLKNDVWYSSDGKNWKLVTKHAGWSPRACHQAVVHDEEIYVIGGGNYVPEYFALNDVWSSKDGIHWTKVCVHAPWDEAKFMRVLFYFDLVKAFGGVPKIDGPITVEEAKKLARSTDEEIYSLIVADLEDAIKDIPKLMPHGRASKGAAVALLIKVFVYKQQGIRLKST